MHFGHIFTRDGLDDISFVVGSVESSPTARLGVVGKGCAPGQGILPVRIRWGEEERDGLEARLSDFQIMCCHHKLSNTFMFGRNWYK